MASKTFIDKDPVLGLIDAEWANEVNDLVWDVFNGAITVSAAKTALSLTVGTNVQAYDTVLQSIAALGTAADKLLYTTGVDTFAETAFTAAARTLLDDVTVGDMLTTLGAAASGSNGDITALTGLTSDIAVVDGGTGASTAGAALTNLGAAASGANSDITELTGLTTDLTVAQGGTASSTAQAAINVLSDVVGATDEYVLTKDTASGDAIFKAAANSFAEILSITGTVAVDALTAGVNADSLYFRNATLTNGAATLISFSALSLVVPSGATLGTVSATQSRIILLAIDNAGTIELAVVNIVGGNNLDETTLISTTAIDATADSDNVIYSTTARTNVAFRVVGFIESTQTTAGTWATAPSKIQGAGGNALTAMSSLGYGQTWQTVTRTSGTTYYNTTGKPISLFLRVSAASTTNTITINGVVAATLSPNNDPDGLTIIIPPSASYIVTASSIASISELR